MPKRIGESGDRTESLSFPDVNDESVKTLLDIGVVVIEGLVPATDLTGIEYAFHRSRRHDLPRRALGKSMLLAGLGKTTAYKKTRVSDIAYDPTNLPKHMRDAQSVTDAIIELNSTFFERTELTDIYGDRSLNLAFIFVSLSSEPAIGEHQDSQGATGLAYAPQAQPTRWHIHSFQPKEPELVAHPSAPIDFDFTTKVGDVVVLTERRGQSPDRVEFRDGTRNFYEDGSRIHSGDNLTGIDRYGMGLFTQEVAEIIV